MFNNVYLVKIIPLPTNMTAIIIQKWYKSRSSKNAAKTSDPISKTQSNLADKICQINI